MKTNKDKLLRDAFVTFLQYNYERASYAMLTEATGLSKAGMAYYYPTKQELFVAVADRFFFCSQNPDTKFGETDTLAGFIDHFICNVRSTMDYLTGIMSEVQGYDGLAPQAHFMNFLCQIRRYYPDARVKMERLFGGTLSRWRQVVRQAAESGEIRPGVDTDETAQMFYDIYIGRSFSDSFFNGLDTGRLIRTMHCLYAMIKA